MGIQPLDEGGLAQPVAAGWAVHVSNHDQQDPGNCALFDESGFGVVIGLRNRFGPDSARVPRVLPRSANRAIVIRVGIDAEKVGDEPSRLPDARRACFSDRGLTTV